MAFAEIHPDYYQIPLADRQALLRAEAEEHRNNDDIEHVETASSGPVASHSDLSQEEQPEGDVTFPTADIPVAAKPKARRRAPRGRGKAEAAVDASNADVVVAVEGTDVADSAADNVEEAVKSLDADTGSEDGGNNGSMAAVVETDTISEEVGDRRRGRDDEDDDDFVDNERKSLNQLAPKMQWKKFQIASCASRASNIAFRK